MRRGRRGLFIWLIVAPIVLAACSNEPVGPLSVPLPPPVDVPFGKMVATVDSKSWESTVFAKASPPLGGGRDVLLVGGHGDSVFIVLQLPSSLPSVGNYVLRDGWTGHATSARLTPLGWFAYTTDETHTGLASVTYIDSTRIAGRFHFTAMGAHPEDLMRVTAGAFNVAIEPAPGSVPHVEQLELTRRR